MTVKFPKNLLTGPKNLILTLITITTLFSPITPRFKCNKRLLNTFLLHGMSFSITKKMKICGNVHDKCCTLSDEIKMSKMWNDRILPMLDEHSDAFVHFISKILKLNRSLLKIDPRQIVLKYKKFVQIPYEDQNCSIQANIAQDDEKSKFEDYEDSKLKKALGKYAPHSTYDLTHQGGQRHWTKKFSSNHFNFKHSNGFEDDSTFDAPAIEYNKISCYKNENVFSKELIMVNEEKVKFCFGLYEKFLNFDNEQFKKFLPVLKNSMIQVAHYKSSFYCALCDVHQQKHFNFKKEEFMINPDFCKTILRSKKEYIEFLHILLIEYFDSMLQYLSCYESEGNNFSFPYQNFLIKYKRRIPFLKECLEAIEEDNDSFHSKCWFICNRFSFLKVSSFFDGNLKLIKRVYLALYSFLRKLRIEREEHPEGFDVNLLTDNIDGMLVEPLSAADFVSKKYYANEETRQEIFGKTDTRVQIPTSKTLQNISNTLQTLGFGTLEDIKDQIHDIEKTKSEIEAMKVKEELMKKYVTVDDKKKVNGVVREDGYVEASGLVDKLLELKDGGEIHSGYFAQRKLLKLTKKLKKIKQIGKKVHKIINKAKNKKMLMTKLKLHLIKKVKKDRKLKQKLKKKAEDLAIRIEPSSAMYLNILPPLDVKHYKVRLRDPGMNPLIHYNLINYKYTIKDIFAHEFKYSERLNRGVVVEYLGLSPKKVNFFNHGVDEHMHSYWAMPYVSEFSELNRNIHDARLNNNKKKLRKFLRIEKNLKLKLAQSLKHLEDKKVLKKYKKLQNDARLEKKFKKVKDLVTNHVDAEHFHSSFEGFKDLFVNLFGN